jgi:two-component system cell cycle sensor histidine kinase/response regulator CckA
VTALPHTPGAESALRFLAHATAELARSLDYSDVVRTVARIMVPAVADWCTVELADHAGRLRLAAGVRRPEPLDTLALPLVARGRTLGILTLGRSAQFGREYDDADLALGQELAARAAVAIDNALLHRAEQQAQERYRAFIEQTTEAVWRFELDEPLPVTLPEDEQLERLYAARLAECNDATARMYGRSRAADIIGLRTDQFLDRSDPRNDEYLRAFIRSGYRLTDAESHELASDGSSRWFLNNLMGVFESGCLVRAWGTQRDITDRVRTERTLRASEERLRTLVDSNMIGIAFWDGERVTDANEVLLRMLGYTRADLEAGLLRHGRLTPPEYAQADAAALAEAQLRGSCSPYEKEFLRKDGSRLPALAGGALLPEGGGVFFVLDLTALRRVQEQLHAAQRMDAVGRLAGGVAHEINNALQAVIGFAAFALRAVAPEHPARDDLAEVDRAARRAATITQQLLAFGRRQVLRPESLDLNVLVAEFTPVIRRALGPEHGLVVREAATPVPVVADRGQLEQVLLNLVLNARDAMPGTGTLTIRTGRVAVPPPGADGAAAALRPGLYGVLEVIDTGHGMDAGTRSRVFEPFFTTKEPGSGTGLGLSVVHGIIAQSGGTVLVVSEPGFGAAFTVLLPEAGGRQAAGQQDDDLPAAVGAGHEMVLVVDDDPMVLDVTRRALTEHGYRVLAATSLSDALQLASRTPVDLLVTDIVMPGGSGPSLAETLAAARGGTPLPVLYISGYTGDEVIRQRLLRPEQPFLQKPFDGDVLARRVRALLDETSRR